MAVSTIKKGVVKEVLTGTIGTSQYAGYYYCELTPTHPTGNMLGFYIASVAQNRPAFVQQVGLNLRVYCSVPSIEVTVVALF